MVSVVLKDFLYQYQYGFRKMRGTVAILAKLKASILNAFSQGKHFFDIGKSYDSTWRYQILQFIHQCGLRGPLAYFIKKF